MCLSQAPICKLCEIHLIDQSLRVPSGLGFGICCRLIDEFLATRPSAEDLTLIFTTRSTKKGSDTLKSLQTHLAEHGPRSSRVHFRPVNVELTNLLSVKALARKLLNEVDLPKLDAVILNAGIAGTIGINFPAAIWQILTENAAAVTWPRFKLTAVGSLVEPQLDGGVAEPPLGQVFCANVFGHYMLSHWLMRLLRKCPTEKPGRVIWISSIEGSDHHFDPNDLQGLKSPTAYEHSKRLTDLLVLTATGQAATGASVQDFIAVQNVTDDVGIGPRPEIWAAHPGIVATSIVPLPPVLMSAWVGVAYVMRWIGSPWHTNTAYLGAISASWLALASSSEVQHKQCSGIAKWGSCVDRAGNARVEKTDVVGWGVDGSGKPIKETWWGGGWGRMIGATDATKEDVEGFVEQGARVWREMEELRLEWEARIEKYEKNQHRQR
jgi:3-keto steroid reductase